MKAGTQVQLVQDPGRKGVLTGRERARGATISYQVRFPDRAQYIPKEQLEMVDALPEDPIDLLEIGKVGTDSDLRRILTHVRLTGRLSDVIYSLGTTNTDFYAYQYKPVLKMLDSPNQGLLIADEVGLGKTIEAGLIWTELRSRFDFRRLLVVCPAMLREKWQRELSFRFGVDARIADARETHRRLKQAAQGGAREQYALISSMQGLRASRGSKASQQLSDFLKARAFDEPMIDLLIIDEAHYMKNPESKTSKLGRHLRRVSSHVALLSATPVHLGSQDLFQLLHLLDEDTFQRQSTFDQMLKANAPLIKTRDAILRGPMDGDELLKKLKEAKRHSLLRDNRQLEGLIQQISPSETINSHDRRSELAHRLESVNLLGHTVTRTRRRDVTEFRVVRNPVSEKISLTPGEKKFYDEVTALVRKYSRESGGHEGFLLVMPQRQMSSSIPAALQSWKQRAEDLWGSNQLYEDLGVDGAEVRENENALTAKPAEKEDAENIGPLTREILRRARQFGNLQELWQNDSKYQRLQSTLGRFVRNHPNEKVVLFSYFRPTLDYLSERLQSDGFSTIVLKGGQRQNKDEVLSYFQSSEGPQILLSSEVASEGVDLQFSRVLINYDLPWNPMKVEQRIGRIDRLGQEADQIHIWNLYCAKTIDARIYDRLFLRLKIFEEALGNTEPILGAEIQRMTMDLLSGDLSPEEEERRIEQTAQALETRKQQEQRLEKEAAHLIAHGDYILSQVRTNVELNRWVSSSDLRSYVFDYLNSEYPGCEFQRTSEEDELYDIALTNKAKYDLDEFCRNEQLQTLLTANDPRPVSCRFARKMAGRNGREEIINHLSPVVRFVSTRIGTAADGQHPAVAIKVSHQHVPSDLLQGVYAFSVQRWSTKGMQEQEKLDYQALLLRGSAPALIDQEKAEQLIVAAAMHGSTWMGADTTMDFEKVADRVLHNCLSASDDGFSRFATRVQNRNEDLADTQEQTLKTHLQNQLERLEATRKKHQRFGRYPLIKATEGRIRKLKSRFERKKIAIDERRNATVSSEDVCVGVIKLR